MSNPLYGAFLHPRARQTLTSDSGGQATPHRHMALGFIRPQRALWWRAGPKVPP